MYGKKQFISREREAKSRPSEVSIIGMKKDKKMNSQKKKGYDDDKTVAFFVPLPEFILQI